MASTQECELPEGQRDNLRQEWSYKVESPRNSEDRLARQLQWCEDRVKRSLSCVYLVRAGDYVKIGVADDVARRIGQMQTGCPFALEVVKTWRSPDPYKLERHLHFSLREYHYRGEWFKLPYHVLIGVMMSA